MSSLIDTINAEELISIFTEYDETLSEEDFLINGDEDDSDDGSDGRVVQYVLNDNSVISFAFSRENSAIIATLYIEEIETDDLVNDANQINSNLLISTAIADEDGSLCLRAVLTLRGGISREAVAYFLNDFLDDVNVVGDYYSE